MRKIICMKLPAGEDVICKVVRKMTGEKEFTDDFEAPTTPTGVYEVENLLALAPQQISGTKMGLALIPWLLGNFEGKVLFDLSRVICVYEPLPDIEASYITQTSGLVTATASPPASKILR